MNTHVDNTADEYDIVILGAGPVGSTLALLLAGTRHRVLLLEQRSLDAGQKDPRALALSEGARQLLSPENAWPSTTGAAAGCAGTAGVLSAAPTTARPSPPSSDRGQSSSPARAASQPVASASVKRPRGRYRG